MVMNLDGILKGLDRFGISTTSHSQTTLLSHLKGTYEILKGWSCSEQVCLAGLCHSIYGTESFLKMSATLDNRNYVKKLIGDEAEQLAYLFGAHRKESLWMNLDRKEGLFIEDRFLNQTCKLTNLDFFNLITLTLANWLEQRPRAGTEYQFLRKEEFLRSKNFLPPKAFEDFLKSYGLQNT